MNLKKFIFLFLPGLFAAGQQLTAQTTSYLPTLTPKAPDAAALMKFVEIPVSPYTGASSVSVPITTIRAKGITIPISVDYHTGGIRLEEEASSTGLGFALAAGGMISRTINGLDDLGGMYFGANVPQPQGDLIGYQPANGLSATDSFAMMDSLLQANCPTCSYDENCPTCPIAGDRYIYFFNCSYNVNFKNYTGDFTDPFSLAGFNPFTGQEAYDLEPDTYTYNFLGKSGKFIVLRDQSTIVMEKQDNIKIQIVQPGPTTGSCVFLVTDENGNKFYFNTTQSCTPAWLNASTPTSWYLSQIVTQQNDVVTFNYSGSGYTSVAAENTQTYEAFGATTGLISESNTGTTYNNVNLSSIDYKDGRILFFSDSLRTDLSGGYKLDSIRILSKNTAGLKLLKSDKFYYSYFSPSATGINYTQTGDGPLDLLRLRLDSVKEFSGGKALKPYSFVYNGVPAVYGEKHSYSVDHWGYFNGAGNTQLIPTTSIYYMGNNYNMSSFQFSYSGANRDPSFPNSQCFSLHRVNYPTGGSSIFNYEANTYDNNNSGSKQLEFPQETLVTVDTTIHIQSTSFPTGSTTTTGNINFSTIYPIIGAGTSGTNATMIVTFVSTNTVTGWSQADKNTFGKLSFNFNSNITDINSSDLTCSGQACSLSIPLTISNATGNTYTATYDPSVILPAHFSEIKVEVTFQGRQTVVQSNPTLTAGGLRIKSIIDSTATGIAKERTWNYHHGSTNQYSNGVLMSFPSYARNELQSTTVGGEAPVLVLFSSSNTQPTSAIGGNIVGYTHVTETTIDPSNSADNGKIVYSYINTPDSVISYNTYRMPGIPNMGNNLNGSEISRITYRNNAGNYWKAAETDNYYHTENKSVYYSSKAWGSHGSDRAGVCNGVAGVENQTLAEFFPSIKSERVLLDSTQNIVFDPADTTQYQLTGTRNYYDNPKHYLLTRSKFTDSKGNTHINKVTYPQDYITSGSYTGNTILDTLIAHNMVTENIEKQENIYYPGSSTAYTTSASENRYKQLSTGVMAMDKAYKLDIASPVTDFTSMTVSGSTYSHDSRYRQLISFDTYDAVNNIAQYTQLYQPPVSIIWDYRGVSPVAQVKGASLTDAAYTSFESDGTGNWTIGSSIRDSVTAALTGTKSYVLSNGAITKTGLTSTKTYVVTYWTKNGSALSITGTVTGYPVAGAILKGWTFYEHQVTGQTTITVSGTGNIDELRLYPVGAEMTSYTYKPVVGVSTISDARGGVSYYTYDGFQRLMNISDQNGNIVKSFVYHYAGQ